MTEYVVRDDQPVAAPSKPIVRKAGIVGLVNRRGQHVPLAMLYEAFANDNAFPSIARMYDLTEDAVEFGLAYLARRQRKKDPIRRQLKANGRACRNRGRDFEKLVTARLARFGFARVPGSGMFGGNLSGDIRRAHDGRAVRLDTDVPQLLPAGVASVRKIECKRQAAEQRFVRKALAQGGGSQVAVIGKPGIEPIAYMELHQLELLLAEAGYEVTE